MHTPTVGTNGPEVSAIGLGCMTMTRGSLSGPRRRELSVCGLPTAARRGGG